MPWQVLQLIFLKWFIINFLIRFRTRVSRIVIKPGPAWWVDPGLGGWTSSSLLKDRPVQRPDKTRSTPRVDPWPGQPGKFGRDPAFWSWIRLRWLQFASRSGFGVLDAFPCFASKQGRIRPFVVDRRAFAKCLFTHSFTERWLKAGNQVLKAFFFPVVVALRHDYHPLLSFIQIGTGFERLWILSRLHFLESMFNI